MVDFSQDIAEKLRLRAVVDQSSVSIPPNTSIGDLPTIFNQIADDKKSHHFTVVNERQAANVALLKAMSMAKNDDLNYFVDCFIEEYLVLMGSVKGFKAKKIAEICGSTVQYEKKLEFARIKSKRDEDFV